MPVSFSRYVDITSGIGAGASVSTRNLGALIVTNNPLVPTNTLVTFTSAAQVGQYFGTTGEEYARAVFYFGWVSKAITTPSQLSFWFWNANAATGSLIYGVSPPSALSAFTAISAGDFTLTLGGYTGHITGINLSAAGSLTAVASAVQTAIRAVSAGGTAWTAATVTYNSLTSQFNLVSGTTGTDTVAVTAGTINDIAGLLGWLTGAILSSGTAAQTVSANLNSLLQISNNFGSFVYEQAPFTRALATATFYTPSMMSVSAISVGQLAVGQTITGTSVPSGTTITGLGTGSGGTGTYSVSTTSAFTLGTTSITALQSLTLTELVSAANWNNSLNPNIQFLFSVQVSSANASAWASAFSAIGGVTLTLASPVSVEYPEMAPMMIEAATDYTARNSVENYMFQQFNLTPSVTTDAAANIYDPLLINYYGLTETAGQNIAFYQRGFMYGTATQPSDQNIYVNEIWFKDAIAASIMTLLLSATQVPANATGQAMLTAQLQTVINQALFNGTISVQKTLTSAQKSYITNVTGSPTAWQQVQTSGYWFNVVIQTSVVNGVSTYTAVYTLVYSKDDVVQSITGSNILI